jgi:hypothetical protein
MAARLGLTVATAIIRDVGFCKAPGDFSQGLKAQPITDKKTYEKTGVYLPID